MPALVLVQGVVFAFASIELVGTAAGGVQRAADDGAARDQQRDLRIGLFYVGSVLLLVLLLPWNAYQAGQSPFCDLLLEAGRAVHR
ncbi:General aromatic amino acid permease [Raoultella planticola]|uniref:General aromatic amino acid permease n=1 Tax=Raoultella planticola TaxID=575 RepID=A0A485AKK5_RAOPL|nr:General aromatic amino acid permease [Raoultella planticola]